MTGFDIKQKIKEEYIFFEQMMLGTSRQNIYNKCEEILFKKEIVRECSRMEFNEENERKLACVSSLLDYIYEIHMTTKENDVREIIGEILFRIGEGQSAEK